MRRIIFGALRRPSPVLGTLFSLALSAAIVTLTASVIGSGLRFAAPAERLAAATVVVAGTPTAAVTSGSGSTAQTSVDDLAAYRRVPLALVRRLAAVPGATAAIPMVSIPLALSLPGGRVVTGSASEPLTGEGWGSAALTPFALREGSAPAEGQIVVGAGLAARDGIVLGERVRLAG
ncbi:MAG TPA: hypothetical protein VMD59_12995, partial [Acidimicrobiales bacterium]|nr:hypothetical protein [Acidimicrobiales bacterium]